MSQKLGQTINLGISIVIIICLKVDAGLRITLFVFLTAFSLIVSVVMFMFGFIYIFNLTLHVLMGKYSMVNNGLRFCDRDSPDVSGLFDSAFRGRVPKARLSP